MFHTMLWNTRMMGPHMRMGFYRGFGWIFWIICLALGTALVLSIIAVVRGRKSYSSSEALNVLAERYARGELTKEEYDQMKKDLK